MLARHPSLAALNGNPKAISHAVSLLLPDAVTPRPISEVAALIEGIGSGGAPTETVSDGCRAVLEQLQQILAPSAPVSPEPSFSEKSPPTTPVHHRDEAEHSEGPSSQPMALAGQLSRQKLPSSLVLRKDEYMRMMSDAALPRWIGSGSLGAVYDVDLGGTRVAVKKFYESACSSSAFQVPARGDALPGLARYAMLCTPRVGMCMCMWHVACACACACACGMCMSMCMCFSPGHALDARTFVSTHVHVPVPVCVPVPVLLTRRCACPVMLVVAMHPARGRAAQRASSSKHRTADQGGNPANVVHRHRAPCVLAACIAAPRCWRRLAQCAAGSRTARVLPQDVHAHCARHELLAHPGPAGAASQLEVAESPHR